MRCKTRTHHEGELDGLQRFGGSAHYGEGDDKLSHVHQTLIMLPDRNMTFNMKEETHRANSLPTHTAWSFHEHAWTLSFICNEAKCKKAKNNTGHRFDLILIAGVD